jgi:pheromone shutdown protein TraB
LDFRNEHIIKEINSDSRKNIAIVYGAAHFDGVLKLLQEKDSTWVEIK